MIKKNPKKNYSLKGKPLSTKIAFLVICIFIFSLFVGSFGGLAYLFGSCSSSFTVSAETIQNETTTVVVSSCSVDVSSIDYEIDDYVSYGGLSNMYALGSISRPFIIRSVSDGLSVVYYLDYYYYDFNLNSFKLDSFNLTDDLGGLIPVAFANFDSTELLNIDFDFGFYSGNLNLGLPATIVLRSPRGHDNYSFITITDVNGVEATFSFSPFNINDLTTWSTHYFTGADLEISYAINPFDIGYIDRVANSKYKEGFDKAIIESDKLYDSVRQDAFDEGKQAGYNSAISQLSDYSFYHLMDAVTYAPLKVFVSLFNFEFLGINVLSLVTFILSVIVVFGIIKFFL